MEEVAHAGVQHTKNKTASANCEKRQSARLGSYTNYAIQKHRTEDSETPSSPCLAFAARLSTTRIFATSDTETVDRDHRSDCKKRGGAPQEDADHRHEHSEKAPRRIRIHRRLFNGSGIRA